MACIAEATSGFPNANGHIPFECATIAEVLGERGWNTYMLGKWHLVASDEMNMASTKRNWPVGRGFERYYGFLGGETNQWYPDLVYDNHPVEQPAMPEDGYHLTTDLTDKAIEFVKDAKMIVPDKPFFMYFCPGATHAPTTRPRSGSSGTGAASTWATSATASRCSSASSSSASSRSTPSCRR
jgi:arylsulfatase